MRGTGIRALAIAAGLICFSSTALAAPPGKGGAHPRGEETGRGATTLQAPADVETAEQLYAKLDYDQANAVAERVVKQRGLSHDQLVRAYRVLAVTYAVLDKEEQARDAFLQLLTYDPDYVADPNLGPKVNNPFVEARGSYRTLASKPGIEVAPSISTSGGTLRVTTRDPTRIVKKVLVGWRWLSSGEYEVSSIPAAEGVPVEVPAARRGRTRLDYYVLALDEKDNAVLEAGNPLVPKSAFVETRSDTGGGSTKKHEEGSSLFVSPVFWAIAGIVVVGGGTAAYFALRPENPSANATLGPSVFCGTERCN